MDAQKNFQSLAFMGNENFANQFLVNIKAEDNFSNNLGYPSKIPSMSRRYAIKQ